MIPTVAPDPRDVIEVLPVKAEVIQMHEKVGERPDTLIGATYKIKSPLFEHALYVTINDIVLNQGTEYERHAPTDSRSSSTRRTLDHFQWIVDDKNMSAMFRKGGDVTFLIENSKPCSIRAAAISRPAASTCRQSSPSSARSSRRT